MASNGASFDTSALDDDGSLDLAPWHLRKLPKSSRLQRISKVSKGFPFDTATDHLEALMVTEHPAVKSCGRSMLESLPGAAGSAFSWTSSSIFIYFHHFSSKTGRNW